MKVYCVSNLELTTLKNLNYDSMFPEADIISIAGNISKDPNIIRKLFKELTNIYNAIVYVNGPFEYAGDNPFYKLDEIERLTTLKSYHKKYKMDRKLPLYPVHLKNRENRIFINYRYIDGNDSICDNSYYNKPDFSDLFMNEFNMLYYQNMLTDEIVKDTINAAKTDTHLFVSRYCPISKDLNPLPWKYEDVSYFGTYSGETIFDTLKDGAVIHYGFLHWKDKKTISYKGKQITFICNSEISPWPKYNRSDYVISI